MRKVLLTLTVLALGCGDPATEDDRGYTKAPLEEPGLLVTGEPGPTVPGVTVELEPGLAVPTPETEAERPDAGTGEPAGGAGEAEDADVALAAGVTREQFDRGRQLFSGSGGCSACHGVDASGSQLGPSLRDDEWLHVQTPDVSSIATVIRNGVPDPQEYPGPMPAMGGANLDDGQVRALAGYIASISGG